MTTPDQPLPPRWSNGFELLPEVPESNYPPGAASLPVHHVTQPDQPAWTPETLLPDRDLDELLDERWNEGHAAGAAEGRRQATEGWDREWGTQVRESGRNVVKECRDEAVARRWATPGRTVVSRLVGPWEPAEQAPCPTCSGPIRETVGMVCQTCGTDYAPVEQDGDGR